MPDDQVYTLDDYAETLIRDKNYQTLTQDMHVELKKDILRRVQDFMISRVITKLSDDQVKEMNMLLDTDPTDQQVQDFVSSSLNNSSEFIS